MTATGKSLHNWGCWVANIDRVQALLWHNYAGKEFPAIVTRYGKFIFAEGPMQDDRYKTDTVNATSLAGNPLGSPAIRDLGIYLPPDYFQSQDRRYPVVYLLHGYAGNNKVLTIAANQRQKISWLPPEILDQVDWQRSCDYEKLDDLINRGEIPPFILVQPDGSLHIPDKDGTFDIYTGGTRTKGCFYINSKHSGHYESYILEDVINYVDLYYRTKPDRSHRALTGVSMGGYGTLSILCHHPEKFAAAAALSPANFTADMLDWKMIVPLQEKLLGRESAEKSGDQTYADILDTQDIVFSKDRPLLPTIVRDVKGEIISMDQKATETWQSYDLNNQAEEYSGNLKKVPFLMNCESSDEFGLTVATERMHATFKRLGIPHEYEIYDDDLAKAFSPHIFGIAYKLIPAIKFVLAKIS
jgi:S-formylglutathione hydrolase